MSRFSGIKTSRWIRFSVASLLLVGFTIWSGNYFLLLLLLLFVDIYLTEYIPWRAWRKIKNNNLRKVFEWIDAILYALIAVYLINNFIFQNYKIPSSSLEKSLLVGDYLLVSKATYGPRVPMTPLSFPLAQHTLPFFNCKSYIEHPQLEYKRLKGTGEIKRNDIVVFNFPAGDTALTKVSNPDYYTLCHIYGRENIKANKDLYGEVVYRPVDRRENYVKRCVGMPGDTFEIRDNQIYINSVAAENPKHLQFNYYIMLSAPDKRLSSKLLDELGISKEDRMLIQNPFQYGDLLAFLGFKPNEQGNYNPVYRMPLTEEAKSRLQSLPIVAQMIQEPGEVMGGDVYPLGCKTWSRKDYGPLWIPKRGETLKLTLENWLAYERVIRNYEGNDAELKDGKIYINGVEAKEYTFKMDYYYMLGDNRDNSADSRYWGFVPEDHIVGKPLFVWLSLDPDKSLFNGGIRFNRIFRSVESLSK
ncbi:MAG: S26 family signal peptidase [Muribaculaceae bacterium]|nr:S26 family signal peptidase [Muribaculaceae bacterium]MBR5324531.1 S26 family signal peptidase [Muribaculaceae bacterium]